MSWENILKDYSKDARVFIDGIKTSTMIAMNNVEEFDKNNPELRDDIETESNILDISNAVIDLGKAIMAFEKMLDAQERLQ
jgi:hypothetical protein|tara:strand:+ start:417 stop:659 length:243 start_codon:yes stop_codon:yes gene_type:complete